MRTALLVQLTSPQPITEAILMTGRLQSLFPGDPLMLTHLAKHHKDPDPQRHFTYQVRNNPPEKSILNMIPEGLMVYTVQDIRQADKSWKCSRNY